MKGSESFFVSLPLERAEAAHEISFRHRRGTSPPVSAASIQFSFSLGLWRTFDVVPKRDPKNRAGRAGHCPNDGTKKKLHRREARATTNAAHDLKFFFQKKKKQDAFADANGAVPAAFRDTLRYLSARGLRTPGLFSTLPDARKASSHKKALATAFFLSFFFFHLERLDKRWQRERESRARCSRAARFFSPSLSLSLSLSLFSSLHSTTPEKTGRAPPPRLGPGPVPPPLHAGHDSGKRR